jgi:hypothetical protein
MVTNSSIIQWKLKCLNINLSEQNNVNLPSAITFFQNGTLKARERQVQKFQQQSQRKVT